MLVQQTLVWTNMQQPGDRGDMNLMIRLKRFDTWHSRFVVWILLMSSLIFSRSLSQSASGQADAGAQVGPGIGAQAPAFAARDQFGNEQSNRTVAGRNGTVLLFFRSADW
jgi:hypothetical protein